MSCKSCLSEHQSKLNAEVAIHFPGLKGLDKPIVWVFPKLLVCLDCGVTEFSLPERELGVLVKGTAVEYPGTDKRLSPQDRFHRK